MILVGSNIELKIIENIFLVEKMFIFYKVWLYILCLENIYKFMGKKFFIVVVRVN